MFNHMLVCEFCKKDSPDGCTIYGDTSWVNRRGGCPGFPYRPLPKPLKYENGIIIGLGRIGQQKQKRKK